jgi:hypothetical protein
MTIICAVELLIIDFIIPLEKPCKKPETNIKLKNERERIKIIKATVDL